MVVPKVLSVGPSGTQIGGLRLLSIHYGTLLLSLLLLPRWHTTARNQTRQRAAGVIASLAART